MKAYKMIEVDVEIPDSIFIEIAPYCQLGESRPDESKWFTLEIYIDAESIADQFLEEEKELSQEAQKFLEEYDGNVLYVPECCGWSTEGQIEKIIKEIGEKK